jgi:hypothetical protein
MLEWYVKSTEEQGIMDSSLPNTVTGDYTIGDPVMYMGSIVTQYGYKHGTGFGFTYRNIQRDPNHNTKQIEELVNVGNAIVAIRQMIKNAVQGEPMTTSGVEAINYAVERMLADVGIHAECKIALENYHTNSSKREALNMALEGFADGIRAVAAAIGRLLKKIFIYIYEDIENAARGAGATARRAVRIQDAAQNLLVSQRALPSGNVTRKSLCEAFNEGGTPMGFAKVKHEYTSLMSEFNTRYSQRILSGAITAMANSINDAMSADKIVTFDLAQARGASNRALSYLRRNGFSDFKVAPNISDNTEVLESSLPFGNAVFTAVFGKEDGLLTGFGSKIEREDVNAPNHLQPLTVAQVLELAREVESNMNRGIYRDYKKIKRDVSKLGNIVSKQCDDIVNYQRSVESGVVPSLNFLKKVSEGVKQLVTNLYGYGGYSNRSVLLYCEYSLKQWAI